MGLRPSIAGVKAKRYRVCAGVISVVKIDADECTQRDAKWFGR